MDDNEKVAMGLCGGQMALGTVVLAIAGGPLWGVLVCGSMAAAGLYMAVAKDKDDSKS